MIVVDTNILVHALVQSDRTAMARRLKEADPLWRVPSLWRYEFANVMRTKVMTGGMGAAAALERMRTAYAYCLPMERELSPELALEAAFAFKVSAYDAAFLALAKSKGIKLVTEDRKLRNAAPSLTCAMEDMIGEI